MEKPILPVHWKRRLQEVQIAPFIHGRCKTPIEEIQAAIDGAILNSVRLALKGRASGAHQWFFRNYPFFFPIFSNI